MNSEELKTYLSHIEEALLEEKRIVTFCWLSKTFGIHCNVAKQLLYTFYDNYPKKEEISVTYLVIGLPMKGDYFRKVLLVNGKDLDEVEDKLTRLTSKHIYSIQKCGDLADINVLFTPPEDKTEDVISSGISAIEFKNVERDNALIAELRHNALPAVPTPAAAPSRKTNSQADSKTKSPDKNATNENTEKCTNTVKDADSTNGNKKSVVPPMFNNATGSKKKLVEKAPANAKKTKGIGAFFTKTANKPSAANETKKVTNTEDPKKVETKSKEMDTKIKEKLSPLKENKTTLNIIEEDNKNAKEGGLEEPAVKSNKVDNKQKTSKKTSKKGSKKKAVKKEDNDQKKRKRLVVLSDSDSNSGSEDDEVIREPTPEPEPTFIPDDDDMEDVILGTPEPSKKRKKRKLVNKTFTDADGFMVTEKHYEEVSASEEDEPMPEKKFKGSSFQDDTNRKLTEKKEPPKIKSPSPQKTKQSSLMSFFKKK